MADDHKDKPGEASPMSAGDEALRLFDGGLFCAESVLVSLAHRQGIDSEVLPAIATGFCSGISQTGGLCGAVSGAVMGLGLAHGRRGPGLPVAPAYEPVRQLIAGFEAEFGSSNCSTLLGCELGTPEGRQIFREQKLMARCRRYTQRAAELAVELLDAPPTAP